MNRFHNYVELKPDDNSMDTFEEYSISFILQEVVSVKFPAHILTII